VNAVQLITPLVVLGIAIAITGAISKHREWLLCGLTLALLAQSNPFVAKELGSQQMGGQWLVVPALWVIAGLSLRSFGLARFLSSRMGLALLISMLYICALLPAWSINGSVSIRRGLATAGIVAFGYGCLGGSLAESERRDALLKWVLGTLVVYVLYQIAIVAQFGLEATLDPQDYERKNMLGYGRFATAEIVNACGMGHSAGTVAAIAAARIFSPGSRRILWAAIACIALTVVVLSGTRGAMFGTIGSLCILLVIGIVRRPTVGKWVAISLLSIGGIVYSETVQEALVLDPNKTAAQEFEDARWSGIEETIEMAPLEHWNPVLGAGAGALDYMAERYPESHMESFVVRVWFEWGLGGVVYLLAILVMSISVTRHEMSTGQYLATPWVAYMWVSSLASFGPSIPTGDAAIFLAVVSSSPRSQLASSNPGTPFVGRLPPAQPNGHPQAAR